MFNEFNSSTRELQTSNFGERIFALSSSGHHCDPISGRTLPQEVSHMAVFKGSDFPDSDPPTEPSTLLYLAPREKEVLLWAARGKSAWETAELLELSEKTVKFYIRNACSRLKAQNKTQAVAMCISASLFRI